MKGDENGESESRGCRIICGRSLHADDQSSGTGGKPWRGTNSPSSTVAKAATRPSAARVSAPKRLFWPALGMIAPATRPSLSMRPKGVTTNSVIRHPTLPTAVGFIIVDESGENQIAVDFGANRALQPADVEAHREIIQASDAVVVQMEIPPETAMAAMRVGRECGVITVLNPAPYQPIGSGWENVDVVTPKRIGGTV